MISYTLAVESGVAARLRVGGVSAKLAVEVGRLIEAAHR